MNKLARTLIVAALVAANALVFVAPPASAAAIQSGSVLTIALGTGAFNVAIETGPASGEVRLNGVPGVADGTLFTGVNHIRYSSGAGGDTLQLRQSGAVLPKVEILDGAGGLVVDAEIDVLATTAPVTSALSFEAGAGSSRAKIILQSDAQDLILDWRTVFGAGIHEVEQAIVADDPSQRLAGRVLVDLGTGASKNSTTIKSAAQAVDLALTLDAGSSGELNLVAEHLASGAATANVVLSGSQKVNWKWIGQSSVLALNGSIDGSASNEEFNVEIDNSRTSGQISIRARNGNDKINVLVKGTSALSGAINGNEADDEIKLFVDGANNGGLAVNGGPGQDTCEASAGVLISLCE
jgi:hypothetical protein